MVGIIWPNWKVNTPVRKSKQQYNSLTAIKDDICITFNPKSQAQQSVVDLWPRSRVLFLVGVAGSGKTACALALSLIELLKYPTDQRPMLMLSRPVLGLDEDIGHLPGTLEEKIEPWLYTFHDVYTDFSTAKWDKLKQKIHIESCPVGMLRGRNIKSGILIIDEAQDLTPAQVKSALTRIGRGGRVIFCADTDQSCRYHPDNSPLINASNKLDDLDTIATIKFNSTDQVRDPIITEILKRL